jgi:hypothetical protein
MSPSFGNGTADIRAPSETHPASTAAAAQADILRNDLLSILSIFPPESFIIR